MRNKNQVAEETRMTTSGDPMARLLRRAYPLSNQGSVRVLLHATTGDADSLEWLEIANPPGAPVAKSLRKLDDGERRAFFAQLAIVVAAKDELAKTQKAVADAENDLDNILRREELEAERAAAYDWWKRVGQFQHSDEDDDPHDADPEPCEIDG